MNQTRVVLITGAGSETGIGFAAAQQFKSQNYQVVITGASSRILERAIELGVKGFAADLFVEADVIKLVSSIQSEFGQLDVLVNNAGMTSVEKPMQETGEANSVFDISLENWQKSLSRNLDTAFLVSKHCLPLIRKSSAGRIINISSVTGPVMAMKNDAAYAAAKAGLIGMTRSLAIDEARHEITVNAVSPGWIATGSQTSDEARQGSTVPLGRSGTADEVASAILWLANPQNGYITGQNIVVDGGNSIAEERA
ncbi:MAG: hypothetical protein RLZZ330_390 [Actinomycetota bacterium]|jgi:3-oxoacyl-[acyl-carrier protein] reductase